MEHPVWEYAAPDIREDGVEPPPPSCGESRETKGASESNTHLDFLRPSDGQRWVGVGAELRHILHTSQPAGMLLQVTCRWGDPLNMYSS